MISDCEKMNKNVEYIQIAIDGTMASGKGTIARGLSEKLGYEYFDTGVIYRKIGLFSLTLNSPNDIVNHLDSINIDSIDGDFRSLEAGQSASKVAIIKEVRDFVTSYCREIAKNKNIIMDGRDIASVIMPNADFKLFITANLEERARRRFSELGGLNSLEDVLDAIKERDERDSTREIAPLKPEKDSIIIDNTHMSKEETLEHILNIIKK